jgi:ribose transport system ATP-binding protein
LDNEEVAGSPTSADGGARPPVIRTAGWSKKFGDRLVLDNVSLTVRPGEVHALVGQNGSGKSTWIKILAGYYQPETGAVLEVNGEEIGFPLTPGQSTSLGVAFVHQDLALNEAATVLENLRAGRYGVRGLSPIRWRQERRSVQRTLDAYGLDHVRPETLVAELAPVDRSLLAIARATNDLSRVARGLLVLDEPTAYLPRDGVARLFDAVRSIASRGFGIIFVSHDLDEVNDISDQVTVLRDGRLIGTYATSSLTPASLSEAVLGFKLAELYPPAVSNVGSVVARVRELAGGALRNLSFDVRSGEIIGFTGLLGSGHDALPSLLVGLTRPTGGRVNYGGIERPAHKLTPYDAVRMGLAVVPANRARDGLVGRATATENVTLPTMARHFKQGVLRRRAEIAYVSRLAEQIELRPPIARMETSQFSGGNQQKLVLAKCLESKPSVLVLHEPTQGVDVGTRQVLLKRFAVAAEEGAAVIVCSTEYEDLAHLCDRVFVLNRGEVLVELSGADLTHARILEACYGSIRRSS